MVVVDQSATDLVVRLTESLSSSGMDVDRVTAPRLGVAAARNRGIEQVRTGWFVISDDDHRVTEDWLDHMHHHLGRHRSAVVTGMVAPAAPGVPSSTTDDVPFVHTRPLLTRDPLFAGNMGTSMEIVSRVGPFDETEALEGAEDNEWGYRAIRLGVSIVYAPDAKVIHLDWRDRRGIEATYRRYARAQGAFYGKHLRRGDLFIALRAARDVARGPWLFGRGVASRNAELTMLGRTESAGILPGILNGLRIRGSPRRRDPVGS
jgi:GT2 family glycosyltransferase